MGLTLLLVEDDHSFAEILAEELRAFDHRVTIAGDGWTALEAVDHDQFDAVILDRMLPRLDGISVLERLRTGQRTLPVIMLSARGQSGEKVEGLEAGADDYVVKPVAAAELNARLQAGGGGRERAPVSKPAHPPRAHTPRAGGILGRPNRVSAWRGGAAVELGKLGVKPLA